MPRPATVHDAALLPSMIHELAEYERQLDLLTSGIRSFFGYYSTWAGRRLFLEDLFVRGAFRRRGVGKALLAAVARVAVDEPCYGIHWEVLDWNEKAIELYKQPGATFRDQNRYAVLFRIQTVKKAEMRGHKIREFVKMLERNEIHEPRTTRRPSK